MRSLATFFQIVMWTVAAWLFVGLLGSLRWLSPTADAPPDAMIALAIKVVGLLLLGVAWSFFLRRADRNNRSQQPSFS